MWSQQDRYHLRYRWSSHRKHQDTGCLPGTQSQTSVAFVVVLVQWRSRAFFFFFLLPTVKYKSVQLLSHVQLFATPWTAARQASLFITNTQSLFKLMSIESVMPSNHLILCRPLLLTPSIFPSIRVFSNESVLHIRWPKYWSFSFNKQIRFYLNSVIPSPYEKPLFSALCLSRLCLSTWHSSKHPESKSCFPKV